MKNSILLILVAFILGLPASTLHVSALPSDKDGEKDEGMINEIAVDFVNNIKTPKDSGVHIGSTCDKSNQAPAFTVRQHTGKEGTPKQRSYICENDDISIELDAVGKPVTFVNKNKKVSRGAKYEGRTSRYDFLIKKDKKTLDTIADVAANALSQESREFFEIDEMSNGYTAYKWKRVYHGYPYDFDFLMVIIDPVDGEIVCASKQFTSNEPTNTVKIDENKAKQLAESYVHDKLPGVTNEILKSEMKIVNLSSNKKTVVAIDTTTLSIPKFTPETRIAYAISYKKERPSPGKTTAWIDAENGQVLGVVTTK